MHPTIQKFGIGKIFLNIFWKKSLMAAFILYIKNSNVVKDSYNFK